MGDGLEEEEPIGHVGFDQHDGTGRDDVEEDDDVENADSVQDHIPWASQGLLELSNHGWIRVRVTDKKKIKENGVSRLLMVL